MFNQNTELILGAIVAIVSYNTWSAMTLRKQFDDIKKINANLVEANKKLNKKNSIWRLEAPKILRIGELNASNIKDLSQQQQRLNRYLADVLNVSDLIERKEIGVETMDLIDDMRQRVQWAKEVEKQQVNDSDFYTGD